MGAAAAPMIIGSAIGAATNRKNPLQGALLGGALGGFGSAFTSGFSSLGNAAANTANAANAGLGMTGNAANIANEAAKQGIFAGNTIPNAGSALTGSSASTAANTMFMNPAGVNPPNSIIDGISSAVEAAPVTTESLINQGLSADLALDLGVPSEYTGLGMAGNTAPSFLDKLGAGVKEIGQYAQQNPVLTAMAAQTAQGLLTNQQQAPASAGLMRGNQIQAQAPQYQVGIPKVSLI